MEKENVQTTTGYNRPQEAGDIDMINQQNVDNGHVEIEKAEKMRKNGPSDSAEIPAFHDGTPPLDPQFKTPDENNNNSDELEDEEESIEQSDEENVEEEEVEMTQEEKKDMYEAVKSGDIDLLEDCLDKPNSDINMTWFKENLLATAIRWKHQEMAEFLLDNGVDHTHMNSVVVLKETSKGKTLERYELSCRQMAYDNEMHDIVELIDSLQGQQFPFIRPRARTPRLRRLRPPIMSVSYGSFSCPTDDTDSDAITSSGSESDTEGSEVESTHRRKKKKTKKGKRKPSKSDIGDENNDEIGSFDGKGMMKVNKSKKKKQREEKHKASDDNVCGAEDTTGEKDKTIGTLSGLDADSGHHSMGSNKLVKALLKQHDKQSAEKDTTTSSAKGASVSEHDIEGKTGKNESDSMSSEKSLVNSNEMNDEGYGSSLCKNEIYPAGPQVTQSWEVEPTNRIRWTKSVLSKRKANNRQYGCFSFTANTNRQDKPLQWRKVTSLGSYAKESRKWHVIVNNKKVMPKVSVNFSEINLSSNSKPGSANSILKKDKSSSASPLVSERPTPPMESKQFIGRQTKSAAHFMRPTKSTITKTRLSPRFASSYGVLDFHISERVKSKLSKFTSSIWSELSSNSSVSMLQSVAPAQERLHSSPLFRS